MKKVLWRRQKEMMATLEAEGKFEECVPLLEQAIIRGIAEAVEMLAAYHHLGLGGLPIDRDKAVDLYLLALERGQAVAAHNLALLFADRKDPEHFNAERAIYYLRLAASMGFVFCAEEDFLPLLRQLQVKEP